ncbi:MAG: hypothetical protein JXR34_13075 [Bacteroidales bacterium]|nr:hypothetical protein [Bacteroidales bacterium]
MNLEFHPMNQIVEETGPGSEAKTVLTLSGKVMFIAQIDYVESYPEPVSLRRPVESFSTFK